MPAAQARIGIIGGTGLYNIEGITDVKEVYPDTPFGKPSDVSVENWAGWESLSWPVTGGSIPSPLPVPSRANIYALKSLGIEFIISPIPAGVLKKS